MVNVPQMALPNSGGNFIKKFLKRVTTLLINFDWLKRVTTLLINFDWLKHQINIVHFCVEYLLCSGVSLWDGVMIYVNTDRYYDHNYLFFGGWCSEWEGQPAYHSQWTALPKWRLKWKQFGRFSFDWLLHLHLKVEVRTRAVSAKNLVG